MGNYNPYAPDILGQEWVPIRDENTVFSATVNAVEYGHGFHLDTARTLQDGRFYVNEIPTNLDAQEVWLAAIYPRGLEDASGPIRRVIIPVDSTAVTGASVSSSRTGPAILLTPEISDYFLLSTNNADSIVRMSFNTQQYTVLTGKRILAVNLLYSARRFFGTETRDNGPFIQLIDLTNSKVQTLSTNGNDIPEGGSISTGQTLRARFGETCRFWQSPITRERLPWVYPGDLGKFDASSINRLAIQMVTGSNWTIVVGGAVYFWYAALEVIFCEEQRLAIGALGDAVEGTVGGAYDDLIYGANIVTLRTLPGRALLPVLEPGDYTLTLSVADFGDFASGFVGSANLNAGRELYALPTQPGVQITEPFPPEEHLDETLSSVTTHVLPQLSLHTSGGPLTEVHAYGRQGRAPVYGGISAIQDIYDNIPALGFANRPYPQVRFYARKFDTTTVPLKLDSTNVTGVGLSVQVTPAEHDLLPEIIDGWKECTLRFPTAPSMGGVAGNPVWRFTSVGEQAGSQWQVLSACAPAVSGIAGNLLNQVPAAHRLGTATYQPPAGDTVELSWLSPFATGAVLDPDCDAVLLFSQDPATITGVSISPATQTVTGVGLGCGGLPCCMVTGIGYNRVTWDLPVNTGIADDTFARTVAAGGWGTASDGKPWTTSGTAGDFSVDGDEGLIDISAIGTNRFAWVDIGGREQDVTVAVRIDEAAESGSLRAGVTARLTDANNSYRAEIQYTSGDVAQLVLIQRAAAVDTILQTVTLGSLRPAQTTPRKVRLQVKGINLRAKAWDSDQPEPWWQIITTDSALATGNNAGVYARDSTGAATSIWYFTEFTVRPPDHAFGGYELQRFDSRTGLFETIMLASSPAVTGFSDYEARVDTNSVYRIRAVNLYQFAGQWSTQVTGAPATPGVSGNGTCDLTGALMFTSNADQTGARNCAYIMQWDADPPTEGFTLPEAQRVNFEELYNRDGRVAFHGTERGLEAFSRQLLIQAAAIDPSVLANVKTLRDLAWADLPYVCVRDDKGNRWYANVRVPDVAIRDNRSKYLATVDVVETSIEPCVVDPA